METAAMHSTRNTTSNGRERRSEELERKEIAPPGRSRDLIASAPPCAFGEPSGQTTNGRSRRKIKRAKEPVKMEADSKVLSPPGLTHGIKRKERPEEDIDPDLVGGPRTTEEQLPPPKRRESAINTPKIEQLNLSDRRNSIGVSGVAGLSESTSGSTATRTVAWQERGERPLLDRRFHHMDHSAHGFNAAQHMQMMPGVDYNAARPPTGPESPGIQSSVGPARTRRSRSRPPSRGSRGDQAITDQTSTMSQDDASSSGTKDGAGGTPYSRSPELRVSHKLAERKRRKEMKDLFDELRDQLPQDRGMKASKWEILSKAIDFIATMKQTHGDMSREIDMLRHEVDGFRQGMPPFHPNGPPPQVMFGQHIVPGPYPPGGPIPPHGAPPHPGGPPPPNQQPIPVPPTNQPSRPGSFPPGEGQNANSESGSDSP